MMDTKNTNCIVCFETKNNVFATSFSITLSFMFAGRKHNETNAKHKYFNEGGRDQGWEISYILEWFSYIHAIFVSMGNHIGKNLGIISHYVWMSWQKLKDDKAVLMWKEEICLQMMLMSWTSNERTTL